MTRLEVRALPLRAVGLQLAAVLALVLVTLRGLDDAGTAHQVLQGTAVLLVAVMALAIDEPGAAVLDVTPTAFARRVARRLALLAALTGPAWLLALGVVALRGADVPVLMLSLQALGLLALGLAVPAGLRRWRRMAEPGVVTGPVLLAFFVAVDQLPRGLALLPLQSWGPPWEVAHLRWAAIVLAGVSVLLLGLSDPATAVRRRRAA